MNSQVSIVNCENYDSSLVQKKVKEVVDLLGGISSIIKPKSKVLVKPNLLIATAPETGVDTHPEVIRAVIKILKDINCSIYLGDGPSVWGRQIENVDEVYKLSGVSKICEEEVVELVKFDKRRMRKKFPLTTWLDECDYVLNVPKFKTHNFTVLTGAIKNLYGLVSGTYKTELHKKYFRKEEFAKILVDIFEEAKPALTIIDGIVAMEGDGPGTSGRLRNQNLILASCDCVALDSVMAIIMGIEPSLILSTKYAVERGLGVADINSITVLGEKLEDVMGEPFRLPTTSIKTKIPQFIINLLTKLIKYYPYVIDNSCTRCGNCIEVCPTKVMGFKNNQVAIDYSGCISCFCCQESCPASAIKTKKSLLAKLLKL